MFLLNPESIFKILFWNIFKNIFKISLTLKLLLNNFNYFLDIFQPFRRNQFVSMVREHQSIKANVKF